MSTARSVQRSKPCVLLLQWATRSRIRGSCFFESLLAQGAGRGEAQIREALAATRRSLFMVFEREIPLT